MYAALLGEKRFFGLLLRLDEDLAAQARAAGSRVCGQAVHAGNFRRKAPGCPARVGAGLRVASELLLRPA